MSIIHEDIDELIFYYLTPPELMVLSAVSKYYYGRLASFRSDFQIVKDNFLTACENGNLKLAQHVAVEWEKAFYVKEMREKGICVCEKCGFHNNLNSKPKKYAIIDPYSTSVNQHQPINNDLISAYTLEMYHNDKNYPWNKWYGESEGIGYINLHNLFDLNKFNDAWSNSNTLTEFADNPMSSDIITNLTPGGCGYVLGGGGGGGACTTGSMTWGRCGGGGGSCTTGPMTCGTTGSAGLTGSAGIMGPTGPTVPMGATGPIGPTGAYVRTYTHADYVRRVLRSYHDLPFFAACVNGNLDIAQWLYGLVLSYGQKIDITHAQYYILVKTCANDKYHVAKWLLTLPEMNVDNLIKHLYSKWYRNIFDLSCMKTLHFLQVDIDYQYIFNKMCHIFTTDISYINLTNQQSSIAFEYVKDMCQQNNISIDMELYMNIITSAKLCCDY